VLREDHRPRAISLVVDTDCKQYAFESKA